MKAENPRALRVVLLNGSPSLEKSKTVALGQLVVDELARRIPIESSQVDVYHLGTGFTSAIQREDVDKAAEAALDSVETADVVVVASPVYRGSYPGMLKHFIDLIDQYALAGTPVVLTASGGSDRHALMIDHELRPLFAFLQAFVAPAAIFASSQQFAGTALLDPRIFSRIEVAVNDLMPLLETRASTAPETGAEGHDI